MPFFCAFSKLLIHALSFFNEVFLSTGLVLLSGGTASHSGSAGGSLIKLLMINSSSYDWFDVVKYNMICIVIRCKHSGYVLNPLIVNTRRRW